MNISAKKAIELIMHGGIKKYKARNSKASLPARVAAEKMEANKKCGAVYVTRTKEDLTFSKGFVVTSLETLENEQDKLTHWTPNIYGHGYYKDKEKGIICGHEDRKLQQINCFVVDIDTKDAAPGAIALAAMDKELGMPTLILETTKGYQVYFVLDKPLYVSNKNNYRCIVVAKRISENIRRALSEELEGVDHACNHFGFFRIPTSKNIVWYQEATCNLDELIDWSKDQDVGHKRSLFKVLSNFDGNEVHQLSEGWIHAILNAKSIKGQKGVIGRDNAMFTIALACYSSGKDQEYTFNLLDEYNTSLALPVPNKQIWKTINSAFKGKWKGASKEYVQMILEAWGDGLNVPFFSGESIRGWYKHKKARKDRVRSHLHEWEDDIIKYLQSHKTTNKGFIYHTQKELCEALNIPRSTLNKVLSESTRIYRHVIGKGNKKQTGLATLATIYNYVLGEKGEGKEQFMSFMKEYAPTLPHQLVSILEGQKIIMHNGSDKERTWDGTG